MYPYDALSSFYHMMYGQIPPPPRAPFGVGPGAPPPGFGPGTPPPPPGFGPGFPPYGGPGTALRPDQPPMSPPPAFTPQHPVGVAAVDPGAIRMCRFKYTYIWLTDRRRGFWTYLNFVGPRSVAGYRWTGRRWVIFGTDLRNISSFVCY